MTSRDQARAAAFTSWANTANRTQRTEKARQGFRNKLRLEIDPEGTGVPWEVERRVEQRLAAHYAKMRLAKARKAKVKA